MENAEADLGKDPFEMTFLNMGMQGMHSALCFFALF